MATATPAPRPSAEPALLPTRLLYFDDTYLLECDATLLAVQPVEDDPSGATVRRINLVLDATVAYPAGGGQPSDCGSLLLRTSAGDRALPLLGLSKTRAGVVHHTVAAPLSSDGGDGAAVLAALAPGAGVRVRVDGATRLLHARLHSAGHLLDVCMSRIGHGPDALVPSKGNHTPAECWVEYIGKLEKTAADALPAALTAALAAAVTSGGAVATAELALEEAAVACGGLLPHGLPPDCRPRVVTLLAGSGEASGCACGGTHVRDVAEIGGVWVTGVRVRKGVTRVSYELLP